MAARRDYGYRGRGCQAWPAEGAKRAGSPAIAASEAFLRAIDAAATVPRKSTGANHSMGGFLVPIVQIIIAILNIYWWIVILSAIASWLIAFGVINTYNRGAAMVLDILYRLTEPVYRPIRKFMPNVGGLDLSPIVVLLIIWFAEMELVQFAYYVSRL
jgi:YggT family protein